MPGGYPPLSMDHIFGVDELGGYPTHWNQIRKVLFDRLPDWILTFGYHSKLIIQNPSFLNRRREHPSPGHLCPQHFLFLRNSNVMKQYFSWVFSPLSECFLPAFWAFKTLTKCSFPCLVHNSCSMDKNKREGRIIMQIDLAIFHFMKIRLWSNLASYFWQIILNLSSGSYRLVWASH